MIRSLPGTGIFAHRAFALFSAARFASAMAIQVQNLAVGWLVYDITRQPLALGLVGLAEFLPAVGLALVTGQAADLVDRRRALIACYALSTLVALGLLACVLLGVRDVRWVYLLVVVFGVSRAFANPAGQALLPNTIPPESLGNAVAWNSTVWQFATIAGPAVGGLLYLVGEPVVFATAAAGFAATLLCYRAMPPQPPLGVDRTVRWDTLVAGLRFIRSRPAIFGSISMDLFAVLLGGATALLPVYARDILHVGPWGLGLLRSMPAVGAVVVALRMAWRPLERRTGVRMFQAVALFGVATIGFGLSTSLPLSLACLFVLGAADMVSVFIRQTLVQVETPDEMRGRVSAVNSVFIGASNELGEFESGALAAAIGTVPSVVAGGLGTLLVCVIWARLFPALRQRDRLLA